MKMKMDLNNLNHQLIIAAMTNMIDGGLTFHQVCEVLEDIKNQTFPALIQISRGEG